ncbi:unnamed protein product [Adineta steineri]|uniref:Peptidase S53 domain-containing protein n=1 Tax=Adineta steineri TaxID=433720 RepID=A0A813UQX4_9BILA|nr:unnamed protein product [Adineta steineri]
MEEEQEQPLRRRQWYSNRSIPSSKTFYAITLLILVLGTTAIVYMSYKINKLENAIDIKNLGMDFDTPDVDSDNDDVADDIRTKSGSSYDSEYQRSKSPYRYNDQSSTYEKNPYYRYRPHPPRHETPTSNTTLCQASVGYGQAPIWLLPLSELSDPDAAITFFLALKQNPKAVQKLERIFWKITDPDSSEYQKWLTRSEINKILTLDSKILSAVKRFLRKQSFTSVELIGTDVFAIKTTIRQASEFFSAQFRPYKNIKTGRTIHLAQGEMCLTDEISQYVDFWLDFVDDPFNNREPTDPSKKLTVFSSDANATDTVTTQNIPIIVPQFVRSYYNIPDVSKTGLESDVSQGALEFGGQFYSEQDLEKYLQEVNITSEPLKTKHILGINDPSNPGVETMLDIEQMVGINPLAETWYFNDDVKNISSDGMFIKILTINELDDLPQILSISYGRPEANVCAGVTNCDQNVVDLNKRFTIRANIEFMKLTMKGITVLVATGDDGVNDFDADCTNTMFNPTYPASSPFVTSVGATTLVNVQYNVLQDQPPACTAFNPPLVCVSDGDEIAVSVYDPLFAKYTSGGGFSNFAPQPPYQKAAVHDYFKKTSVMFPPPSMYNRKGRAYPDVAAFGVNIFAVVNGTDGLGFGTSISAPLWAGIVSILNSRSIKITGKTLGFLNPLLYKMAKECPECLNDITVGNNKCTRAVFTDQCKGFQAACGWDPVTGLGTPNAGNILQYITELLKKKMKKTEYN